MRTSGQQPGGARRRLRAARLLAALAALAWAAPAAAAEWVVDRDASRLEVVIEVGGKRLAGAFETWDAEIAFDPEHPDACRVRVVVDVSSLGFPDPAAAEAARGPEWLDATGHPQAVFEGAGFDRDAPGDWSVDGTLTLKGATRPLALDVLIDAEGEVAEATVSAELLRGDYAVGDADGGMVGPSVEISARVTARRAD